MHQISMACVVNDQEIIRTIILLDVSRDRNVQIDLWIFAIFQPNDVTVVIESVPEQGFKSCNLEEVSNKLAMLDQFDLLRQHGL
jgi:hypothetical protein